MLQSRYAVFCVILISSLYGMENSDNRYEQLKPYISEKRQQTLEDLCTHFQIPDDRWSSFVNILAKVHAQKKNLAEPHVSSQALLAAWGDYFKHSIDKVADASIDSISLSSRNAAKMVVDSMMKHKEIIGDVTFEQLHGEDRDTNAVFVVLDSIRDHTFYPQSFEDVEDCVARNTFEPCLTVAINPTKVAQLEPFELEFEADCVVEHSARLTSLTDNLIKEMLKKGSFSKEVYEQTLSWHNYIASSSEEIFDAAVDGDSKKHAIRQNHSMHPLSSFFKK